MLVAWLFLAFTLLIAPQSVYAACNRFPTNSGVEKSPVDEHFAILIRNNPQNYLIGQEYNVTLNAYNGHRFIAFSLALENENGDAYSADDLGRFEIIDEVETRFSPNCGNMIESTNTNPKTRIEVTWVAPTNPDSGCVLIRATVVQHRFVWHMDDGGLTRRICPEYVDEIESRRAGQDCCACDEARYELTFQGNWNRNLHPKDFPPKGWITRFGDIIGAAHTYDYRFWSDGVLASEGMQEYAEHGSTRILEKEFNENFKEGVIRTIIKSRGPAFPNINGISVASVRVDSRHHLISLASKIDPSPDWFVGIAGMELCMQNCTWLEERVVQLFPWDAGTDAGPSYTSPDQPQRPPDVIRRIRSNLPNDPRSPFYDENGVAMYPMATLIVKRQRVYERSCEDEDSNNVDIPRECYTHPWTAWTECSAKCGDGRSTRTRVYKQAELAKIYNCDEMRERRQSRVCKGENCFGPEAELVEGAAVDFMSRSNYGSHQNMAECELSEWSEWSECSKTCGEGTSYRRRQFRNIRSQEACQSANAVKLVEYKKCQGLRCLGDLGRNRQYGGGVGGADDFGGSEANNFNNNQQQGYFGYMGNSNFGPYMERSDTTQFGPQAAAVDTASGNEFWHNNAEENVNIENRPYWSSQDETQQSGNAYGNAAGFPDEIDTTDLLANNRAAFEVGNLNRLPTDINKMGRQHKFNRNFGGTRNQNISNSAAAFEPPMLVPGYCFHKLYIFNCLDPTVVGNFWFFNYCQNECMLYAADRCDKNENKFTSLEACEQMCQRPENEAYLRQQQNRTCSAMERRRGHKRRKNKNW